MNIQTSFDSMANQNKGVLYLVPTPIGNLEDMTFRSVRILKEVDLILAEDTRNSIKLLNHFDIETPMRSFHEYSKENQIEEYISLLLNGQNLAAISDAGMPLINDPGHPIVQKSLQHQISVVALPGANAALTALIASGLSCEKFTYYGFFPRTPKEQRAILEHVAAEQQTAIFYESPHRLIASISMIEQQLGEAQQLVVARELTKKFETYWRGTAQELSEFLKDGTIKGECVLLLGPVNEDYRIGRTQAHPIDTTLPYYEQVEAYMAEYNVTSKEAIKHIAKLNQVKKQRVYVAYHEVKE